jgi:hypothetical protein
MKRPHNREIANNKEIRKTGNVSTGAVVTLETSNLTPLHQIKGAIPPTTGFETKLDELARRSPSARALSDEQGLAPYLGGSIRRAAR